MVLHGVCKSFSPTQLEGEERERERERERKETRANINGADWLTVHIGHPASTYRVIGLVMYFRRRIYGIPPPPY